MTLLLSMLPFYLISNLHCAGMCGPLVAMIGQHRHRYWYFLGRLCAFTFAAGLAGAFGSVISVFLYKYRLSGLFSIFFGVCFIGYSWLQWKGKKILFPQLAVGRVLSHKIAGLLLHDTPWHTFIFGFAAILLPCGQSLLVFSACALTGDLWTGILNGMAFAGLTSPSLFFAMRTHHVFKKMYGYYDRIVAICILVVGILALCRGLADWSVIDHLVLFPAYHVVLY